MNLTLVHPVLRESLACFEILRGLGVPSEDIFFVSDATNTVGISIQRGAQAFVIKVGQYRTDVTQADLASAWTTVAEACNTGAIPDDDLDEMVRASAIYARKVELLTALRATGIWRPRASLN